MNSEETLAKSLLDLYDIEKEICMYSHIYIYGAGMVGKFVYDYLASNGMADRIETFLTTASPDKERVRGIAVKKIDTEVIKDDSVILLSAKRGIRKEMLDKCHQLQISEFIEVDVLDDRDYEYYSHIPEAAYKLELCYLYRRKTGKELNLECPQTFNEKINWSKLYDKDPRRTEFADKFSVRKYVENRIGENYLIPLLGVWDRFEDIDFGSLPDKFILKCTHGSGWNVLVHNKKDLDLVDLKNKISAWMSTNYAFINGFEMHYAGIEPRIIAEQLIGEGNIKDYKFFVFDGKVELIEVDWDRWIGHKRNVYTPKWEYIPCSIFFPNDDSMIEEQPARLDEMLSVAERLGDGFSHVRVDLYSTSDAVYFGEMTFSHGGGFERFSNNELNEMLGEKWKLSK